MTEGVCRRRGRAVDVASYSLAADGDTKLSEHFRVGEFACHDGSDRILIAPALVALLQAIRSRYGQPVRISSGYRTEGRNTLVGGSPTSQHLAGTAADIVVAGVPPIEMCRYAEHLMPSSGGIGLYPDFVHMDVRAGRSRWDQRSGVQVGVGGFPGYEDDTAEPQVPSPAEPIPVRVLCPCCKTEYGISGLHINGQVWVPVRAICEHMGHAVEWDGDAVTIT
jgi:hypothetical protein